MSLWGVTIDTLGQAWDESMLKLTQNSPNHKSSFSLFTNFALNQGNSWFLHGSMVQFTREDCIIGEMRNVMLEKEKRDTLPKISERDNIMNESDEHEWGWL